MRKLYIVFGLILIPLLCYPVQKKVYNDMLSQKMDIVYDSRYGASSTSPTVTGISSFQDIYVGSNSANNGSNTVSITTNGNIKSSGTLSIDGQINGRGGLFMTGAGINVPGVLNSGSMDQWGQSTYGRGVGITTITAKGEYISQSSVTTSASITAGKFYGDGSAITGIVATSTGNVDDLCRESTGTITGLIDSLEISTATLDAADVIFEARLDGFDASSATWANTNEISYDYLTISSAADSGYALKSDVTASLGGKMADATDVVVSTHIADGSVGESQTSPWKVSLSTGVTGLLPDSLRVVSYSTCSIFGVFADTVAVNLVGMQSITRVPFDAVLKNWYIVADDTGSATISISTGMITGSGLTFGAAFLTATLSSNQYATGAIASGTMQAGYYIKFLVTTAATCKELYPSVEVWRKQ